MTKKITGKSIKDSLMKQLKKNGVDQYDHYVSLVDDYVSMWNMKNELIKDVEERGVNVKYNHGGGQEGWKKNDSVPELNRTNGQMLKLLSELGLSASDIKPEEEEVEL